MSVFASDYKVLLVTKDASAEQKNANVSSLPADGLRRKLLNTDGGRRETIERITARSAAL